MAKTLVIKDASFAENKLDTVTLIDPIPCKGITLTTDSFNYTSYGESKSIEYTLTPANTTDSVTITSGNTNIVEINNGNAIAYGVGNTSITITCGSKTATISVTSSMKMTNKTFKSGKYLSKNDSATYCTEAALDFFGYCGTTEAWGNERVAATSATPYIKVARIPKNVASITVNVPDSSDKAVVVFFDSTQTGSSNPNLNMAKCLSCPTAPSVDAGTRTVSVPEGADSFAVNYRDHHATSFDVSAFTNADVTFNAVS